VPGFLRATTATLFLMGRSIVEFVNLVPKMVYPGWFGKVEVD
jgi:hypothetical protein